MLLELLIQHTILFLRDVTKRIQGRATDPLSSSVHNTGENTALMSLEADALLGTAGNLINISFLLSLLKEVIKRPLQRLLILKLQIHVSYLQGKRISDLL